MSVFVILCIIHSGRERTAGNTLNGLGNLGADGGGDDGTVGVLGRDEGGRSSSVGLGRQGRAGLAGGLVLVVGVRGGLDEALDPGGGRVAVDVEVVEVVGDNITTGADGVGGVAVVAKAVTVGVQVGQLGGRAGEDAVAVAAVEVVVALATGVADITEDESGNDWHMLV